MATYNNQAPTAVNNVGLYGATDDTIGAYKQASEYAADARYWALLAESKFGTVDDLIAEVERLYQQGILMQADIEQLKQDFEDQDARLMVLIAEANAAASNAQNAVDIVNLKLIEIQEQLDILLAMKVTVETLPPGSQATGSFNNQTGEIHLGIPEGEKGADGSVTDLSTVDTGIPEIGDLGFYVDKDDNTVHKTTLENIANLIPSVRSISVNGGPELAGEVALTIDKSTVGLDQVLNVPQYSQAQTDAKIRGFVKTYTSLAEAQADVGNRARDEKVLVWNGASYDFYTVGSNSDLSLTKSEPRILTVNSRIPDSTGNIDITIPTGNPSLYLGEMLMFPYDPDRPVAYQGVLPADGRVIPKSSAEDLGSSLLSGQIPVVSETDWQNGANTYFSWGKLADGVTDADASNYIQIRLPDWTGGTAIRTPDYDPTTSTGETSYNGGELSQKPYVVTVNGLSPDEITGNVQLTASSIGAVSNTEVIPVSRGGTGATNADQARSNLRLSTFLYLDAGTPQSIIYTPDNTKAFRVTNDAAKFVNVSDGSTIAAPVEQGGTGVKTVAEARTVFGVNRLHQNPGETLVNSPDGTKYTTINNAGDFGVFDTVGNTRVAFPITSGGTGALTVDGARSNLKVDRLLQESDASIITAPGGSWSIAVNGNTGDWGGYDTANKMWNPLGVNRGGTGASDPWNAATNIKTIREKVARFAPGDSPLDTYWKNSTGFLAGQYELGLVGAWMDITSADEAARMQLVGYYSNGSGGNGFGYKVYQPNSQTWYPFRYVRDSGNTTIDGNGFIKAASPIVDVYSDGSFKANAEAEGVSVEREAVGVYLIKGCLGTNSDKGWGGVDGGFEIPTDRNKQPRIWLDYEVLEDGSIKVKTYHRTHPTSPVFARNEIEGFADGDAIDIPADTFISVRVGMPESK